MGAGASVDVAINSELAKVLSASDGDLAAAAEKANREIVRVVPKTGSGRFDPERGERAAVLQVVERAHLLAQHGYAVSWQQYNKPETEARRSATAKISWRIRGGSKRTLRLTSRRAVTCRRARPPQI